MIIPRIECNTSGEGCPYSVWIIHLPLQKAELLLLQQSVLLAEVSGPWDDRSVQIIIGKPAGKVHIAEG